MAPLSAAALRDEVRGILRSVALNGFVRIAAPGGALLVTDVLRRASGTQTDEALGLLEAAGMECREDDGLLWISPGQARMRRIAEAAEQAVTEKVLCQGGRLTAEISFAMRLLLCQKTEPWSRQGEQLFLEALRLPDCGGVEWPEAERLRPPAAVMLRRHDRSAMHETGALLLCRITQAQEKPEST